MEKTLYTAAEIQEAIGWIASRVLAWLEMEKIPSLRVLSVLEGARPFTRDLVTSLRRGQAGPRVMVYEVRVKGTQGTQLLEGRELDLEGLDLQAFQGAPVLIVDDLADSGGTLLTLKDELKKAGAGEVRTAVLIRKWGTQSVPVDFCGLDLDLDREVLAGQGLKDRWLYGYGMDLDGRQRDLDHIGSIDIKSGS